MRRQSFWISSVKIFPLLLLTLPRLLVLYAAALWRNLRVSCRCYIGRCRCSQARGESSAKLLMGQFPEVSLDAISI